MTEKEFNFVKQQIATVAGQVASTYHSEIYLRLQQGKQINLEEISAEMKKRSDWFVKNAVNEIDTLNTFGYTFDELTK
jgi:hypothetical protein